MSLSSFFLNTCAPAGSASKRMVTVFLTGTGGWAGGVTAGVVVVATGGVMEGAAGVAPPLSSRIRRATRAAAPPPATNSLVRLGLTASSPSSISDDADDSVVDARDEIVDAIVVDGLVERRRPPADAGAVTLTS